MRILWGFGGARDKVWGLYLCTKTGFLTEEKKLRKCKRDNSSVWEKNECKRKQEQLDIVKERDFIRE